MVEVTHGPFCLQKKKKKKKIITPELLLMTSWSALGYLPSSKTPTPSFLPSAPKIGQLSKPPLFVFSWSPPKNPIFKWTPIILKLFILKKFRSREVPLFENLVWGSTPSPPPAAERGKGAHYGRGYKNFGRNWVLCKCLFSRFADTMNKNVKVSTIAKETI